MELRLIYNNGKGRMNINLRQFLDTCGVTKFKRLLKVIELTETPEDHINKLREYLINNMPVDYTDLENNLVNYVHLVKVYQDRVDSYLVELNTLKEVTKRTMKNGRRASAEMKILRAKREELNDKLKNAREDLKVYKSLGSDSKKSIKLMEKRQKDFNKYLDLIKDV